MSVRNKMDYVYSNIPPKISVHMERNIYKTFKVVNVRMDVSKTNFCMKMFRSIWTELYEEIFERTKLKWIMYTNIFLQNVRYIWNEKYFTQCFKCSEFI